MSYVRIGVLLTLLLGATFFGVQQVQAVDETTVLKQKQLDSIKESCEDSKYQLEQLHASDALIRVNIGQEYTNLSSRLMAPLNSRISINGLDGVELSRTTVNYNRSVAEFQQKYLAYEASVSAAIKTNCLEDPANYYSHIKTARRLRVEVNQTVKDMNQYIDEYQQGFEQFARSIDRGDS